MSVSGMETVDVGKRLRIARETAGLTQAEAADGINVARTTLIAMEKGQRAVRAAELLPLARLYGTSVNALLRRESVYVDLVPRFRKLPACGDGPSARAAGLLADLARAEVELENLLGVTHPRNYPPPRPLLPGDICAQADNDATELRQNLGLGLAPVRDPLSLLELDLGVRVYVRRLDAGVSGLFAYDEQVGACMLLNANHPYERRVQTAAHETRSSGLEPARARRAVSGRARQFPRRTVRQCLRARLPDAGADGPAEIPRPYARGIALDAAARHSAEPRLRGLA